MTVRWRVQGERFSAREVAELPAGAADARETLHAVAAGRGFEGWARGIEEAAHAASDSPADYAKAILKRLAIVRDAIARSDADTAARYAAELGALVREADLKFEFEAAAVSGAKAIQGANDGRASRLKTILNRNRAMAIEFRKRRATSNESDSALKERIGQEQTPALRRSAAIAAIDSGLKS